MLRSHVVLSWSTVTMCSITRRVVGSLLSTRPLPPKEGRQRVPCLLIELDATQQFEAQYVILPQSVYYSEEAVSTFPRSSWGKLPMA